MVDDLGTVTLVAHANNFYEARSEGRSELGAHPEGALFHLWDRRGAVMPAQGAPRNLDDCAGIKGPIFMEGGIEIGHIPNAGQD
jgi:hypothetical protein